MKEFRDQSAHVAAALVALLPLAFVPGLVAFLWAGFMLGLVREITEEGSPVTGAKVLQALRSWPDLLFWTIGGGLAGVIHGVY